MPLGGNAALVKYGVLTQYAKAVVNPGESFVNKGGVWLDWSDESLRLDTLGFAGDVIETLDPLRLLEQVAFGRVAAESTFDEVPV